MPHFRNDGSQLYRVDKSESIDECSKLAKEVESETSANDKNNNCEDLNEQSYAKLQCPHGIRQRAQSFKRVL